MIKALVFDFDGLIVNTEGPDYESYHEMYDAHGAPLSLELWTKHIGAPAGVVDLHAHLEELVGRSLDREVLRRQRRGR